MAQVGGQGLSLTQVSEEPGQIEIVGRSPNLGQIQGVR